jgi:hypothetical protein
MNAQSSGKGKEKEKPKGNPSQGQPKKPNLAEKLGKDGKLTQQECQRRQGNNLCLFCGQAGHQVRNARDLPWPELRRRPTGRLLMKEH